MTIRNPVVWGWDQIRLAVSTVGSAAHDEEQIRANRRLVRPVVRTIGMADIRYALAKGLEDFSADPTHYVFMCAVYPVIGLILGRAASGYEMVPLVFPLVAGFALLGPFAAVGVYELSRRREKGYEIAWWHAFSVFRSPNLGAILKLGLTLTVTFILWLVVAEGIYRLTFGPEAPASVGAFARDLFTTRHGWVLIVAGNAVGFLFAVLVLMLSVASFPLIIDRGVSAEVAMRTSIRAVLANPTAMAIWGLIVAVALVVGSLPFLLGLVVVIPVLGHATWHLYRRVIEPGRVFG